MKISLNWLKEIIDIDCSVEDLSKLLTNCGLEVEGIEEFESVKGGLKGVVIGKVITCEPHPDSDHLHVTTVDVGGDRLLDIGCGAANVAAGQKVVVATVGTIIYSDKGDFEIKKSKIRGCVSEGMICAEDELGLGTSHAGIMVLPDEAFVGCPAADYFKIERDTVFEIGLTPNRNDATGHIGVAKDVSAVLNVQNAMCNVQCAMCNVQSDEMKSSESKISVEVIDDVDCPRYSGITLTNITVKESPEWLKNRLKAVGIRPINNVVDVTNWILMHYGQPLHAFDLKEVKGGKIIVKKLPNGSKFTTLDGVERTLNGSELMICNAEEGMCIAGVFGGEKSGVKESSTDIFIESAYFNPLSIRKTSKLHGLKTDASFRYERGCDPNITVRALEHAVSLLQELAGAKISSEIIDIYPNPIEKKEVEFSFANLNRIIGIEIPKEKVIKILENLDFIEGKNNKEEGDVIALKIPTNKADVTREIDVIEEIIRIYGFEHIENKGNATIVFAENKKPNKEEIYNIIAERLVGLGFSEILNNSLISSEIATKIKGFNPDLDVVMANPLSSEMSVMRQSLLFGGLTNLAYNINRQNSDLKFFEFGNVYHQNPKSTGEDNVAKQFKQINKVSLLLSGNKNPESWQWKQEKVDFDYLKSIVLLIFNSLKIKNYSLKEEFPEYFDYGISYYINEKPAVVLGKISKATMKYFDIKQDVYFAEFDWDLMLKSVSGKPVNFTELPKFPAVRRDLALLIDKKTTFKEIEEVAYRTERKLLKKVDLFDVYEGDKLPDGKKSYAVAFILQDENQTMSDKAITSIMNKLIYQYKNLLGAEIR
jgi:phenylalanyl-tRNA synthetase beta chain